MIYAQPENRIAGWPRTCNGNIGLADVIGRIDATILVGLSTVSCAFSETICPGNGAESRAAHHSSALKSDVKM